MDDIVLRPKQDVNVLRAENDPKPQKVEVRRRVDKKISWQDRSAMIAQQQARQQAPQ